MPRTLRTPLRILFVLLFITGAAYVGGLRFPAPPEIPELNGFYKVMQVYDGDTISILKDGKRVTVRLIGIDSPEVDTVYTRSGCFGSEASAAAKQLMNGAMVRIETDPTQALFDQYERLLAYVYVQSDSKPEGIMANAYMIREGFAREYTYKKPYVHRSAFIAEEAIAQSEKKGLWAACTSS